MGLYIKDEKQILSQLIKGDKCAFEEIYKAYWKEFYSFAFKITNSDDESKDLVQEIFMDLWISKEKINPEISLKPYFFISIKNKFIDRIRKSKRFEHYANLLLSNALKEFEKTPEENLILIEKKQNLLQMLEILPQKCREIFILNKLEELSIPEISQKLNISPQTVKNQLTKASKIMRPIVGKILVTSLNILWITHNLNNINILNINY